MSKLIWGNCIVRNEDRYLWFGIKSVINYLDKLMIWDTGSTDNTIQIIKLLQKEYPQKIVYKEKDEVNAKELTKLRQEMLQETKSDWLMLLDGDEVWWDKSIKKVRDVIEEGGDNLACLANPVYNLIGDIYHYQEELAGEYVILGKKGHYNVRLINRKIPGLHVNFSYGREGYYDINDIPVYERDNKKVIFVDAPLLHFTHLSRSTNNEPVMQRNNKFKYEIGIKFPQQFVFPEVLTQARPLVVPSPWNKMTRGYFLRSIIQTPFKQIKRRLKI